MSTSIYLSLKFLLTRTLIMIIIMSRCSVWLYSKIPHYITSGLLEIVSSNASVCTCRTCPKISIIKIYPWKGFRPRFIPTLKGSLNSCKREITLDREWYIAYKMTSIVLICIIHTYLLIKSFVWIHFENEIGRGDLLHLIG